MKKLTSYQKAHTKAPVKTRARIKKRSRTKGGRNSDPKKLAWLRTLPCAVRALATCGGVREVHHDRPGGARATDKLTVPLCTTHHRTGSHSVEQLGRQGFQAFHGIDLSTATARYETEWQLVKQARRLMVGLRELKALIP